MLAALLAVLAIGLTRGAHAATYLSADLTAPDSGAGVTQLTGLTCDQAASTLNTAAANPTKLSLPVGPLLFPTVTSTDLTIDTDVASNCTTLTLEGATTILGISTAQVLVVAQWPDATSTSPVFTVLFKFENVGLSSLVSSTSSLGVELADAWIGVTTAASPGSAIVPGDLPASAQDFLDSEFDAASSGITFRGELSSSPSDLNTGLTKLGVSPGGVQLDGSLSGSLSGFSTTAAPTASASLSLTASIKLGLSTPDWLSFPDPMTLTLQGASDGSWSIAAAGDADVTLPNNTTATTFSASITLSKSGGSISAALDATASSISDAFNQSWLTLNSLELSATISSGSISGELDASATIDSNTYTIVATLASDGSASVTLSTTATIDAKTIAADLGLADWPASAPNPGLGNISVFLGVDADRTVTVSATATATMTLGSFNGSVDVLIRDRGGSEGGLLVAVRPSSQMTLNGLLGTTLSPDVTLPQISVVIATKDINEDSSGLDGPTKTYFQQTQCDTSEPDCDFTLDIKAGVGIEASVTMPDQLVQMFCTMLSESTCTNPFSGPIVIDGQIPLFGGTTTSLTINLPAITVASGAIQSVSAFISISATDNSLGFSIGGTLLLFAPGTGGAATCPGSVTPPSGDVCLDLSISGALSVSPGSVSVTITGSLTGGNATSGWQLPGKVSWLTINDLVVQIGVTTGAEGGAGVTLGARAAVLIGDTDLEFSIDLEIMAEAPWVNLLGISASSQNGLSMTDLAALYTKVSGQSVDSSALPPVAVRNLYFSYSSVPTPDPNPLCLDNGIHISGELVLTNSGATPVTPELPTGADAGCTPPSKSSICSSDSSSCLASVYLSIDDNGIDGKAALGAWTAGPVIFDGAELDFTLNSSEVQLEIKAGGTLLDPVQYAADVQNNLDPSKPYIDPTTAPVWLSGSLDLAVGTQELALHATGNILGKSASVNATGSFDLSNPGFNLTVWFNDVKEAFNKAGQAITNAADTVANTAETWYSTYVAGSVNQVFTDINDLNTALTTSGQTQIQAFYNVYNDVNTTVSGWNSAVPSFMQVSTNDIVNDTLHGLTVGNYQICGFLGCVTIVPGFTIPGACSYVPSLEGSQICTVPLDQLIDAARAQFADPAVTQAISGAGLTMPPGSTPGSVVKTIKLIDPPAPSSLTCAMATANYTTGYLSPTNITVNSLGTDVTFQGPNPTDLANSSNDTTNNQTLSQDTFNGLYSGQNTGTCTPLTEDFNLPTVTLALDHGWIYERDSVTASGFVTDSTISSVSIDWGDGSTPTTATVISGQYTADHTYADEDGLSGQASPFTIAVSANGSVQASKTLSVFDKPVAITALSVSPGAVNIMDTVTVNGAIDPNPEPDTPTTITISWGDGTPDSTVTLGPSAGPWTFSAQHVYQKLVPGGSPSATEAIRVTAAESATNSTTQSTSVIVNDVPPSGTTLAISGPVTNTAGTVFTHAGATFTWLAQSLDISPQAVLTFRVNWADGSADQDLTGTPLSGPDGQQMYTYGLPQGTHAYVNACFYNVQTTVTDSDTLSAPLLQTPVVATEPLGSLPLVSADWQQAVGAAISGGRGIWADPGRIPCYLSIAAYLSPQLGGNSISLQAASSILNPFLGGPHSRPTRLQTDSATLKQLLLTSLLNFSHGTWDWTQVVDRSGDTYGALVAKANTAMNSGSTAQMEAAIALLRQLPLAPLGNLFGAVLL